MAFLGIAVAIVTVLMWFAALFTGRVPGGMWRFSKGVLQWVARTDAYTLFLTDRYPPFETGDAAYPVSVTLDPPDRFNRLAVLFRVVLVIPAAVVASAFTFGVYVFAVVPWLVTLVVGRCPRSLHLVLAAWLRYELRYSAYYGLLATEYPWGPLGDRRSASGSLESGEIVLRGASKALAVVAIVLGAALYVSDAALPVLLAPSARAQTAVAQLHALQSRTVAADAKFRARAATCATTWRCVGDDTSILERALQTQISTIEAIGFPSDRTRHDAASILAILEEERSELSRVQGAGTPQAFASDMNRIVTLTRRLQPLVLQLQEDLGSAR